MKRTETRKEKVKQEHLVEMVCDLCGAKQRYDGYTPAKLGEWEHDVGDLGRHGVKVTVQRESNVRYGRDGGGECHTTEFDLCPTCFERLAQWLQEQGAAGPRKTEDGW